MIQTKNVYDLLMRVSDFLNTHLYAKVLAYIIAITTCFNVVYEMGEYIGRFLYILIH